MRAGPNVYDGAVRPGVESRWWSSSGPRSWRPAPRTDWDIIPQMQVTLSTRQHIRLCGGAKIPLERQGRS